jgi:hypothetical protein
MLMVSYQRNDEEDERDSDDRKLGLVAAGEISKYTPNRKIGGQSMNFQSCRGEVSFKVPRHYCEFVIARNRSKRKWNEFLVAGRGICVPV